MMLWLGRRGAGETDHPRPACRVSRPQKLKLLLHAVEFLHLHLIIRNFLPGKEGKKEKNEEPIVDEHCSSSTIGLGRQERRTRRLWRYFQRGWRDLTQGRSLEQ